MLVTKWKVVAGRQNDKSARGHETAHCYIITTVADNEIDSCRAYLALIFKALPCQE